MFLDTTRMQMTRAIGAWLIGSGLIALPQAAFNPEFARSPMNLTAATTALVAGVACMLGATARLRRLNAHNRPFLMSPSGPTVLPVRRTTFLRVVIYKRVALGLFLASGVWYLTLLTMLGCANENLEWCTPSRLPSWTLINVALMAALLIAVVYLALVIWTRTHDAETERMEDTIAEGERRRRGDDPLAEIGRRWD